MSKFGDFEFDELKDLQNNLGKMQDAYPRFIEGCLKELAGRLLAKTIARTPVDTGELRRGWTIGQVQRTGNQLEIEIINPVEHAKYVEYGHRTRDHKGWVEGRFMLTVSEDELKRELPGIIERKMQQFMRRHLGW
ncbi:HK97 gp10 family phage protein [Paenibacillus oleatilyticus]|uniref:HK97 gp10 family phage protein n=1 Tax=Paenibacillus oleatilyticus TaxID=2594886 RepID=A0ABV4UT14_9BACL